MAKQIKSKNKFLSSFTYRDFVFFVFALAVFALGLIFIVLGLIDDYTNIYGSILKNPNSGMKSLMGGVGFTWFGVICVCVSSIVIAITLSISSKGDDREKEKEARRNQRRQALSSSSAYSTTASINKEDSIK